MKLLVKCPKCERIFLINYNDLVECPICFKQPLRSITLNTRDLEG